MATIKPGSMAMLEDGTPNLPARLAAQNAPLPDPRGELLWIGVDLDGTLAEKIWTPENPTRKIGPPIKENVEKAHRLAQAGYKIMVHTSRGWTDYEAIETWLNHHSIPWRFIQCGKPLCALYVDDRAREADSESWLPNFVNVNPPMKALIEENQDLRELVHLQNRGELDREERARASALWLKLGLMS